MQKTILLLLTLFTFSLHAGFAEFKAMQMKQFQAYKDALDKEFGDYLNKPFKPFKTQKTQPKMRPKPTIIKAVKIKEADKPVIKKVVIIKPIKKIKNTPPAKVIIPPVKVTVANENAKKTMVAFYGHKIYIKYDNPLDNYYARNIKQSKISDAWKQFATSEYVELINQIKESVKVLNLNDWGRLKLLEKIGKKVFRNKNESRLFSWFAFTKMGFDMRVGYQNQAVILLVPINTELYSTTYYTIGGKRYYAIDYATKKIKSIKSYESSYPTAKKVFDLEITKRPKLKQYRVNKNVKFKYKGKQHNLNIAYDKVYVAYYSTYPQVGFGNYFASPVSPIANKSFRDEIAKIIEGKSEVEAVNMLLRLVQKGFDYKVDQKQFGYEKVMLPEETLFYPYSDCEDRSILFSKLVTDLLGLEVVGIEYDEHLSTAVVLKSRLTGGSSFTKDGKRYYMADPTYIGSNIGMIAPQYKKAGFKIIKALK